MAGYLYAALAPRLWLQGTHYCNKEVHSFSPQDPSVIDDVRIEAGRPSEHGGLDYPVTFKYTVHVPDLATYNVASTDAWRITSFRVIDETTHADVTDNVHVPLPVCCLRESSMVFTPPMHGPHTVVFTCEQVVGITEHALQHDAYLTLMPL